MCFLWKNEFSCFSPFSLFLPVTKEALLLLSSTTVGIFFLFITFPLSHSTYPRKRQITTIPLHAVSFIVHCLPGCEGIPTTPTASECSRTGRATGRASFQLSMLKRWQMFRGCLVSGPALYLFQVIQNTNSGLAGVKYVQIWDVKTEIYF